MIQNEKVEILKKRRIKDYIFDSSLTIINVLIINPNIDFHKLTNDNSKNVIAISTFPKRSAHHVPFLLYVLTSIRRCHYFQNLRLNNQNKIDDSYL